MDTARKEQQASEQVEIEPRTKKVKLTGEVAKNELSIEALKAILPSKFEVGSGILDETPPKYSPFYRYYIVTIDLQSIMHIFMVC